MFVHFSGVREPLIFDSNSGERSVLCSTDMRSGWIKNSPQVIYYYYWLEWWKIMQIVNDDVYPCHWYYSLEWITINYLGDPDDGCELCKPRIYCWLLTHIHVYKYLMRIFVMHRHQTERVHRKIAILRHLSSIAIDAIAVHLIDFCRFTGSSMIVEYCNIW